MSTALDSYAEYSRLIFSLLTDRATVERHTLAVYTTSRTIGITRGQIVFRSGHVLRVFEQAGHQASSHSRHGAILHGTEPAPIDRRN